MYRSSSTIPRSEKIVKLRFYCEKTPANGGGRFAEMRNGGIFTKKGKVIVASTASEASLVIFALGYSQTHRQSGGHHDKQKTSKHLPLN